MGILCHDVTSLKSLLPGLPGREYVVIKMKLDEKTREIYLEGLKRYQERGVRILVDGEETDASRWDVIFEVREDGSFYMGDYILEDEAGESRMADCGEAGMCADSGQEKSGEQVCEPAAEYGKSKITGKRLKEIRFDRVYNR